MKKLSALMYIGALTLLMATLSACSTSSITSTGKTIKDLYDDYLNPPASIDYELIGTLEDRQYFLAESLLPVQGTLNGFSRAMSAIDSPPRPDVVNELVSNYSWISGVAAVDVEGTILAQEPAIAIKELDYMPLVEYTPRKGAERALHAFVQDTVLGPEVIAASGIYVDGVKRGYFIGHFDMSTLMYAVPTSEYFAVFTPQNLLFEGGSFAALEEVRGKDWEDLLQD